MNRTYYTLRTSNDIYGNRIAGGEQETWPEQFETFAEAYDYMCLLYTNEKNKNLPHRYWGVWRTSVSEYNGHENSMTQAVWGA